MPGNPYTSPWIEFVTPWMDIDRSPDTSLANTFTQRASPVVNANRHLNSNSLSDFWPIEYKPDLWLISTFAGPNQSSTSRPNTRDSALTSVDGENQEADDTSLDSTATGASALARSPDLTLGLLQQPLVPQMDGSTEVPDSSAASQSEHEPQMATRSEISNLQVDAPHTTHSPTPTARQPTPFQAPQPYAIQREDLPNPAARPFQTKFVGPRASARRTNHTGTQPAAASHTNSKTWESDKSRENNRWQRLEDSLRRMNLLRSSVVPKTLKDWLVHQRERMEVKIQREQTKLKDMNFLLRDDRLPPPSCPVKIGPGFRGKIFEHKNYSSVLVCPSVWARMYEPPAERPDPPWPCVEEMKEEGDERNTSGFRRFLALPRVPGNDTVQYKLKAIQNFLPFDTIWKLPTKESVEAANEKSSPEEFEKMEGYLGRSLLDALDCITEDGF